MVKRMLVRFLGAAVVLAAFAPLSITASAAEMNCRVPFSFAVNGKTMPAGTYVISTVPTAHGVLQIRGASKGAIIATQPMDQTRDFGAGKLVFLKIGGRYDLVEVWGADGQVHGLTGSRRQLEERARAAGMPVERIVIPAA
jgi:hypothetical protein